MTQKTEPQAPAREHTRTGLSKESLKNAYIDNLFYVQGRFREVATTNDLYMAAAFTVRDRLLDRWLKTAQAYKATRARTVCYLSAEFLLGPHLVNNMVNLGCRSALGAAQVHGHAGLQRPVAGAVPQHHQRCDPAPLHREQPAPGGAADRSLWR